MYVSLIKYEPKLETDMFQAGLSYILSMEENWF
jgi:hypothetical protein